MSPLLSQNETNIRTHSAVLVYLVLSCQSVSATSEVTTAFDKQLKNKTHIRVSGPCTKYNRKSVKKCLCLQGQRTKIKPLSLPLHIN